MGEILITRESDGAQLEIDIMVDVQFSPSAIIPQHPIDPGIGEIGQSVVENAQRALVPFVVTCKQNALAPAGAAPEANRERTAREFLAACIGQILTVKIPRRAPIRNVLLQAYPYSNNQLLTTPFELSFLIARFATAETVFVPRIVPRAKPDTTPEVDDGEVPFVGPLPPEKEPSPSLLKSWFP